MSHLECQCVHVELDRLETVYPRTMFKIRSARVYQNDAAKGMDPPPIWYRFLQMLWLTSQVSSGNWKLDNTTIDWVEKVNREMESTLQDCIWLSRLPLPSLSTVLRSYERLVGWIGAEAV